MKKPALATKAIIVEKLSNLLDEQKTLLESSIADAKNSRDQESKSSMGDKFETGRARLQSEIDRLNIQLSKIMQLKNELLKIDINKQNSTVDLGTLLFTSKGNYFISIGYGKIELAQNNCYAISLASPIGQLFKGKMVGDVVKHQNNSYDILEII